MLARINLWTFCLPGLRERPEDIEPNLLYELDHHAERTGGRVSFNREAKEKFLRFAMSHDAQWTGNFRDLNGAVTRMATLAPGGRITIEVVEEEIARLRASWRRAAPGESGDLLDRLLDTERLARLDLFERTQLETVVRVCREARTLSDAGRMLFAASRGRKSTQNDADRLRKYLARFGLDYKRMKDEARTR